ncbi:MAG: (d)CMP kinase, partial [Muribaculaceae bacterium]|nr:(d)CMP kinase [Muribaculaceae bacterium]
RNSASTVLPDDEMIVCLPSIPEVRAKRRYDELIEKGTPSDFESVLANIKERDHIDSTRKESPLRKADDAFVLDNDNLTREEQIEVLVKLFEEKTRG